MADIEISEDARSDLDDIRATGIERFGEDAAENHLRSIRQSFTTLSAHPMIGQARPEFREDIRSISRRPHRILYRVRGNTVLIVRIIHQARDVAAALRGES